MVKKSIIEEIFSKARFADDTSTYKIFYRDFERVKETTLTEFIKESNDFQTIPISRIKAIKKNHRILFEKNSKKIE
ncbi:MAG: DUF504 domain-containing protein [Nitrosopumilus sp.]|jgi:hypothetical protein|nr:DUF504 domain-containing protein [Nitrosopumilus sp.]